MELKQLIQLKDKGYSNRKVARELGISRNTVNSYATLFTEQGLSYQELSSYSESQLRELFPARDSKQTGRHLFIDFAGKKLEYVDRKTGEVIPVDVFVGILPCSQYTFVRACRSQKREELVEALNQCLRFLGGVPKAIVSDNMKAAVARGHRYAPIINKTIKAFGIHYDTILDPTRPYKPKDKAMVEGAVKLVYQRIYYPLSTQTFFSLGALNKAISEQLEAYNDQYCFQHTKTTRRQRFLEVERQHLQALPPSSYQLRYYKRATVQKISHIWLADDKAYYSVPYRYVGREVQVEYSRDFVEIYSKGERPLH